MADTVESTETAPTEPLKNDAPAATSTVTPEEAAELKRQRDQAEMRARQLEKEKQDREKQDEEAARKKLAQDSEYQTLAEREKERADRLQQEIDDTNRRTTLQQAENSILSGFSSEVRDTAQDLGINLLDDDDTSKTAFTQKLESIQTRLGAPAPTVKGNNPPPSSKPNTDNVEKDKDLARLRYSDNPEAKGVADAAKKRVFSNLESIKEMKRSAGLQETEL